MRPRTSEPHCDLSAFPSYRLETRQRLFRIHGRDRGPWWFASDGSGRWDLPPPEGTCYVAEEPLGAFVEVFRAASVAEQDIADRALATLRVPEPLRVADVTRAESRRFGVTLELSATTDFALTQRWARAFRASGFGGIRYRLRHDPAAALVGIAVFGRSGEPPWQARDEDIDDAIVDEARTRFGLVVVPAAVPAEY